MSTPGFALLSFISLDNNSGGINRLNHTIMACNDGNT